MGRRRWLDWPRGVPAGNKTVGPGGRTSESKRTDFFFCNRLNIVSRVRTLPGKHLEEIAEQLRIHNINALMVIGGFEVSLSPILLVFSVSVTFKK